MQPTWTCSNAQMRHNSCIQKTKMKDSKVDNSRCTLYISRTLPSNVASSATKITSMNSGGGESSPWLREVVLRGGEEETLILTFKEGW